MVLPWTTLAFYTYPSAPFSKGRAITYSTASRPQSNLSFLKAANYNSKSERSELL